MIRNKKGQFTSEGLKGNKFAKGNPGNKTTFRTGRFTMDKHPSWKGGVQHNRRDGLIINVSTNKRMPMSKYVWQKVYGELPKGYIIYHKDQDIMNNNIDNLEAITRAELLKRNHENNILHK